MPENANDVKRIGRAGVWRRRYADRWCAQNLDHWDIERGLCLTAAQMNVGPVDDPVRPDETVD